MKVCHISMSDIQGGAARAGYRIHRSLLAAGIDSRMRVRRKISDDWTVEGPASTVGRIWTHLRPQVWSLLKKCHRSSEKFFFSTNLLSSQWAHRINREDWDVVHLHWIGTEMISIADIGRIRKPVVWTLHDMHAFCGAEHYTMGRRWKDGYYRHSRPEGERGVDLNRWMWKRKRKHWKRPMHIVTPSSWLGTCARQSALMRDWPVDVIPNPLDPKAFAPVDSGLARDFLGLSQDKALVAFGAIGGGRNFVKGFDLLIDALNDLRGYRDDLELVVFGQSEPKNLIDLGFPVNYTGHLHDDLSLRMVYSAADVMVVPSRMEAFGQTASEAHACGTPVVAFDATGVTDIVDHKKTGYLARPYDPIDLSRGIQWVLKALGAGSNRIPVQSISGGVTDTTLSSAARSKAVSQYASSDIGRAYLKTYHEAKKQNSFSEE